MRIAIVCNDTRGGVQPYVGLGLRRAGHEVRAIAPSGLAPMFAEVGLPVAPLSGPGEDQQRAATAVAERGTLAAMRMMLKELPIRIRASARETLGAAEGSELLTGGVGGMVTGLAVAERLGVPFVETHLQPLGAPTDAYPGVLLSGVPGWLGGVGRRLSHHLSESALWLPFRGAMAAARQEVLGRKGQPKPSSGPILYGFRRHVVPMPEARKRPRHVTGYWTLPTPTDWSPPPSLEAFLARGGPVVSVGFGSMASSDPSTTTAIVVGAARDAGVRAVLLSGWGGLDSEVTGDNIYCADALPHTWLFPKVSAIAHHGGAGTSGVALGSGVPSIVIPLGMDQFFWASRVAALGAGPPPIPRKRLTRERLAEAFRRAVGDGAIRARAAEVGAKIRGEDGVGAAVEVFGKSGVAGAG